MKVLVISDTHRYLENAERVIEKFDNIRTIIHLGDLVEDVKTLRQKYPQKDFINVAGNNDFSIDVPFERIITLEGKRILLTHGHRQRVSNGVLNLAFLAEEKQAEAALFGHTHRPFYDESAGVAIFNPGSISLPRGMGGPTFGTFEIKENGRILFDLYRLLPSGEVENI